jgi:hypothetical protein
MEEKAQSSRVYDAREMAWSVTLKAKCEAKDKRKMSHPQSDKKKVMVMQSTSEDYPPPWEIRLIYIIWKQSPTVGQNAMPIEISITTAKKNESKNHWKITKWTQSERKTINQEMTGRNSLS